MRLPLRNADPVQTALRHARGILMSFTTLLVPTFQKMLNALSGWLEKAGTRLPEAEAEALLSARLAPDMFPLSTQIRFACVQAQEAIHRLRGLPFPLSVDMLLEEGRSAGAGPGSLSEARARIAETIALLEALPPHALDRDPDSRIAHQLPNGMVFDLTAEQYARDWALAQFYFHIMIAYGLLRSGKVELGKADYIPHMLPHLRVPSTSEA
jgi:hypothetical protein